ncbi:histidine phosphotransferase family protein [Roseovarius arcticus]|uniref:histidine phosphotransferase family protein n=1 Tax=Roseovarius arcticus TaxID=2547404 RepID=UPI0011109E94|nr:histidine phosphotransferase family protein [Roseovarius arcticus]
MTQASRNLGALIGARICHDLISPVGAISNGLELMGLSGVPEGPEMAMVVGSAAHANARLRFFRVAFGLSSDGQSMTARDLSSIIQGVYDARVTCDWQVDGPLPRKIAQAAFLALLCAEQAVPLGGTVTVTGGEERLHLSTAGERLDPRTEHWAWLSAPEHGNLDNLPAAQVQFALLPGLLAEMDRSADIDLNDPVTISF